MKKQPLSQAAIDLGLGMTEAELRNSMFTLQVKILFARADFEGLARDLQRLSDLHARGDLSNKSGTARDQAAKVILDLSGSAWAKRIVRGLLTRLPRGEDKQPARGAPPADRVADAQWVTTWTIWKRQNPGVSVRQFIEWHRYTFKKLPRPSQPDKLEGEISSAKARFERARKRYSPIR